LLKQILTGISGTFEQKQEQRQFQHPSAIVIPAVGNQYPIKKVNHQKLFVPGINSALKKATPKYRNTRLLPPLLKQF